MSDNNAPHPPTTGAAAQPLAPGNFDRAWNDPPLFSYSTSTTAQPITANRLNKRVPFPTSKAAAPAPGLDSTAPPKLSDAGMIPPPKLGDAGMIPPPSSILPPPPPSMMTPASYSSSATSESSEIDVEKVESDFKQLVKKYIDINSQEDILKRITVIFASWHKGAFNNNIHVKLRDISESMMNEKITAAENMFTVLSADWSNVIGPANILVIKKLINAAKDKLGTGDNSQNAIEKPL